MPASEIRTKLLAMVGAILLIAAGGFSDSLYAEELRILAPTEMKFALQELVDEFQRAGQRTVSVVFDSSGGLFARIKQGENADLFFSSDRRYAERLIETSEAESGTLYRYGVSSLVLWAPKGTRVNLNSQKMQALVDPLVKKIAIPDPTLVPPGKAAVAALAYFGLTEALQKKIILTDTSWMAARYVESGAADLAIIPLSLATGPSMLETGVYWEIPRAAYPTLEICSVILRDTPNRATARAFLLHINSKAGRTVLNRYGLLPPR